VADEALELRGIAGAMAKELLLGLGGQRSNHLLNTAVHLVVIASLTAAR
jgi:hypothetical protein